MVGNHKIKDLPFKYDDLNGISEQVNKWHHDTHYAGYVNKRNEVELELEKVDKSKSNVNWSLFRALKDRETFNANGQILHEIYWDVLGGNGEMDENLEIAKKIKSDFGSIEKWREDFIASAKAAIGWSVLALDLSDGKLKHFIGDAHNQGGVWGAIPIIAMDMYEHAYYHDYGPDRAKYIEAYLKNIDWKKVNQRYKKLTKLIL